MRLVFAGTPEVALPSLDALIASTHEVAAVLTRPPAPAGRGRAPRPSPVHQRAAELGIPVVQPIGGHAVYIDARTMLPHIDPLQYPGQALAVALYETGGIRSVEIGTFMFGLKPDGSEEPAAMDLVRLAIPRRTYTQSHVDYVIEVCEQVAGRASELPGYRITWQPPALRHFTAKLEQLG